MPKLTTKAIRYGRTDPNYRKATLLKIFGIWSLVAGDAANIYYKICCWNFFLYKLAGTNCLKEMDGFPRRHKAMAIKLIFHQMSVNYERKKFTKELWVGDLIIIHCPIPVSVGWFTDINYWTRKILMFSNYCSDNQGYMNR